MSAAKPLAPTKRGKGPRPKHVPQRMCVACRTRDAKRGYVRLVRTAEHGVQVDPTGKQNGRGAYLCRRRGCWQRALDGRALEQALKIEIDEARRAELRDYARSHFPPDDEVGATHAPEELQSQQS